MVADRITVVTRRAGTEEATRWESTGDGGYTLEAAERSGAGTTVTLHLKPVDEEDGLKDYTKEPVLQRHHQALLGLRLVPHPPQGRDAELDEGDLGARQGRGHRGGAPRVLQAHQPRLERPARAHQRAHGGRVRGPRAPLHPVQGAVRPAPPRRRPPRPVALRQARLHHGRLAGAAARLPALRARRRRPPTTSRSTSRARSSRRTGRSRPSASTWCAGSWPRSRR